jgi:hypothetical protein
MVTSMNNTASTARAGVRPKVHEPETTAPSNDDGTVITATAMRPPSVRWLL